MRDVNPNFFPLPYNGSAIHNESWAKGKALEGKKVTITRSDGTTVTGRVHRAETSCDYSRRFYGVGFTLISGSGITAQSHHVRADFTEISEIVETYKSIRILFTEGEGYHGSNGCDHFGYADTVEELRAEIDDYWMETQHGPLNGNFVGDDA